MSYALKEKVEMSKWVRSVGPAHQPTKKRAGRV